METGFISDGQITASSKYDINHEPTQGRLHFKADGAKSGSWSVLYTNLQQWLQVDLGHKTTVTGVASQGRNAYSSGQWVTKYKLQYSDDGVIFQYYKEQGQDADKVKP